MTDLQKTMSTTIGIKVSMWFPMYTGIYSREGGIDTSYETPSSFSLRTSSVFTYLWDRYFLIPFPLESKTKRLTYDGVSTNSFK